MNITNEVYRTLGDRLSEVQTAMTNGRLLGLVDFRLMKTLVGEKTVHVPADSNGNPFYLQWLGTEESLGKDRLRQNFIALCQAITDKRLTADLKAKLISQAVPGMTNTFYYYLAGTDNQPLTFLGFIQGTPNMTDVVAPLVIAHAPA